MKVCTKCLLELEDSAFRMVKNYRRVDGTVSCCLKSTCIACELAYNKEYKKRNKERVNEWNKKRAKKLSTEIRNVYVKDRLKQNGFEMLNNIDLIETYKSILKIKRYVKANAKPRGTKV